MFKKTKPLNAAYAHVFGNPPTLWERLAGPVTLFVILFAVGALGYYAVSLVEYGDGRPEPTLRESVYQTAILLTGVGFGDVLESNRSWPSTAYTVVLAFFGMGFLMYFISTITAFIVGGELGRILEVKKMRKRIEDLAGHYIVCGGGETGRHVVAELQETGRPFVLLELGGDRLAKYKETGDILCIQADATEDDVLLAAGIERAVGLISSLPADKDNLLLVITARQLNPKLRIISRCIDLDNRKKLLKAGADSVVSPNMIGGMRMASEMLRPAVVTFLDTMLRDRRGIRFENIRIPPGHALVGKTLAEANFPALADVNIVATRESETAEFVYNPRGKLALKSGMELVAIGSATEIEKIRAAVERRG